MEVTERSFERTVVDVSDRFQGNAGNADNWTIAQDVVHQLGGIALNIGGTSALGDQVGWGRSSMSDAWLERYEARKYHLIDPFIAALLAGHSEVMTDCGTLNRTDPAYELNHDLKAFGYGSLYASMWGSPSSGYRSIVVFCSAHTLAQVDESIGFDRLKIVQAILSANLPNQTSDTGSGVLKLRENGLTTREKGVLKQLARGLRNDQIAFTLDIAEVTVRKHLVSIRKKLKAETREQAIAIAIRDGWIAL